MFHSNKWNDSYYYSLFMFIQSAPDKLKPPTRKTMIRNVFVGWFHRCHSLLAQKSAQPSWRKEVMGVYPPLDKPEKVYMYPLVIQHSYLAWPCIVKFSIRNGDVSFIVMFVYQRVCTLPRNNAYIVRTCVKPAFSVLFKSDHICIDLANVPNIAIYFCYT